MTIFHSYVSLPEGMSYVSDKMCCQNISNDSPVTNNDSPMTYDEISLMIFRMVNVEGLKIT